MSTRRNVLLASAALVVLAVGFFALRSAPKQTRVTKGPPKVEATAVDAPAPDRVEPAPAPPPVPSASGPSAAHMEEKRRLHAEAEQLQLDQEEAKYAAIDFSAKRPGPPPPAAPLQGKNEKELTPAEKAAQVERMIVLTKARIERTAQRAADAEKAGDKDESSKQTAILARLRKRQGELEYRGKILRGEDVGAAAAASAQAP